MASLAELVQGLPQELFDRIVGYTFSTPELDGQKRTTIDDNTTYVTLDESYKPPFHLQINRATRAAFAKKYYTKVCFIAPDDQSDEILCRWLNSLPYAHVNDIRFIELDHDQDYKDASCALIRIRQAMNAVTRDCREGTFVCKAFRIRYIGPETFLGKWIDWYTFFPGGPW